MTDSEIRRHGLESFLRGVQDDSTDASVDIRIQPGLTHLNLRGDAEDAIFLANAQKALGQALPVKPNTTTLNEHRAYWLGPDEWLLITEADRFLYASPAHRSERYWPEVVHSIFTRTFSELECVHKAALRKQVY
jgi:sarcosine oxidase gamma subunit